MEISSMTKRKMNRFVIQYKTVLAITGAMEGNSGDKIHQELGLELFKSRR